MGIHHRDLQPVIASQCRPLPWSPHSESGAVLQQRHRDRGRDRDRPDDRDKAAATVSRTSSHSPLIGGVCPHCNTGAGQETVLAQTTRKKSCIIVAAVRGVFHPAASERGWLRGVYINYAMYKMATQKNIA